MTPTDTLNVAVPSVPERPEARANVFVDLGPCNTDLEETGPDGDLELLLNVSTVEATHVDFACATGQHGLLLDENSGSDGLPGTAGPATELALVATGDDFLLSKNDPAAVASRIAEYIHSGVRETIAACVLLNDGMQMFEADRALRDRFLEELANRNVIPKRSARLGGIEKSKLSMLRKIGTNADLLLDDRIFPFLESGRPVLFHVIRLFEDLPGDSESRIKQLAALFETQGSLSRSFLIDQLRLIEKGEGDDEGQAVDPLANGDEVSFDCVLITPVEIRDFKRLAEDYADALPACLRIHGRVSKDATWIMVVRVADLPVIGKLLPDGGLGCISRVLLLHDPLGSNVTEARVVVVATVGSGILSARPI